MQTTETKAINANARRQPGERANNLNAEQIRHEPESVNCGIFIRSELDDGLTPNQKVVLAHLNRRQGKNKYAYPTLTSITKTCGYGRGKVERTLGELEALGALKIDRGGPNRSNRYFVQPIEKWLGRLKKTEPAVLSRTTAVLPETSKGKHRRLSIQETLSSSASLQKKEGSSQVCSLPSVSKEREAISENTRGSKSDQLVKKKERLSSGRFADESASAFMRRLRQEKEACP
jgi:DNA-binding MarR family transcriptional regulator